MSQALPFALENLIQPELEKIRELVQTQPQVAELFPGGVVEDPCRKYCAVLDEFVTWYFMARKTEHSESSILEVAARGEAVQASLKALFPERAGIV